MGTQPFITFREDEAYYILQKEFPHYCGKIVNYPIEGALINQPIASYNLYVTFNGVLRGNYVPSYNDVYNEIVHVFSEMANWYYLERIFKDPKRFKKWRI